MRNEFINEYVLNPEQILTIMDVVDKVMERLGDYPLFHFDSFVAMLMEEYCYQHDLKVEEELQRIADAAKEINEMLGRYEKD